MEPAEWRAMSSAHRRYCPEAMQEGMGMDCSPTAALGRSLHSFVLRRDIVGESGKGAAGGRAYCLR